MSLQHIAPSALAAELRSREYAGTVRDIDGRLFDKLRPIESDTIRTHLIATGNHGRDNRVDPLDPTVTFTQRHHAESVGLIIHESALSESGDTWLLNSEKTFRESLDAAIPLCPQEKYRDEPVVHGTTAGLPSWSCCLVHSKAVLTCAHDLPQQGLDKFRVVFGYRMTQSGARLRIPKDDVHQLERIFGYYHYSEDSLDLGADWALLLLKRRSQRPVAAVAEPPSQVVGRGEVYAIGHPHCLPMKICRDAYVQATCIPGVFASPLDTDDGNSGSPVFYRGHVIGVVTERQESTADYEQRTTGPDAPCYARQQYSLIGREVPCTHADGSTHTTHVIGQLCTSASRFLPALESLRAAYP